MKTSPGLRLTGEGQRHSAKTRPEMSRNVSHEYICTGNGEREQSEAETFKDLLPPSHA